MTDDDRAAAEELALEMPFIEATKWLRSVSSLSLRECWGWAERLASNAPTSRLAKTKVSR